ncbi:glucose 1-dehydrogenase [soil metagenome]
MAQTAEQTFPTFDLTGKRALVTGATKGIGHHAALSLAHAGADLFLTGRDVDQLDEVRAEVRELGRDAEAAPAELADIDAVRRLAEQALESLGGVDVLVNNAGLAHIESFLDTTVEAWDETLDVNLRAPYFLAQTVARHMVDNGTEGSIINISSAAALGALDGHGAYCSSKAGLLLATKVMALELGPAGIRVNAICPTVILTPMAEQVWGDPAKGDPMKARIPLGKFGYPPDVSGAVVFLASDASRMVTGAEMRVDGGYHAV